MELPKNAFKHAIAQGHRQIGFWLSLGSAAVAEVIAGAGYDWVMIDAEHGPNDVQSVVDQLRVLERGPATPMVRPAWNDPVLIKRFIGPSDLAADRSHLGEPGHPEVQAAIADAIARSRVIGKPMGTFAPAEADARREAPVSRGATTALRVTCKGEATK